MYPLNFPNDSVSDLDLQSPLSLSLSLSFVSRCGSDWGVCGPEAAGHGGGEEAKGSGAGGPGGAAEEVHVQEPDDWLRNTVSFYMSALLRGKGNEKSPDLISVLPLSLLAALIFLQISAERVGESEKHWTRASDSSERGGRRHHRGHPISSVSLRYQVITSYWLQIQRGVDST